MTIVIPSWQQNQRASISKALRARVDSGVSLSAPFSKPSLSVVSSFDGDFVRYAARVGDKADAYWLRLLQYAALHAGITGVIPITRPQFGPIVLSRPWDVVEDVSGGVVYDVLRDVSLIMEVDGFCPLCAGPKSSRGHVVCQSTLALKGGVVVKRKPRKTSRQDVARDDKKEGEGEGPSPSTPSQEKGAPTPAPATGSQASARSDPVQKFPPPPDKYAGDEEFITAWGLLARNGYNPHEFLTGSGQPRRGIGHLHDRDNVVQFVRNRQEVARLRAEKARREEEQA